MMHPNQFDMNKKKNPGKNKFPAVDKNIIFLVHHVIYQQ